VKGALSTPGFCNTAYFGPGTFTFCPSGLQTAYSTNTIPSGNGGAGKTVAIVVAYHYAGAEADLNKFSSDMGLPACTTASGCLTTVTYSTMGNSGWETEEMLDLEYVHAVAPNAKLLLVEASDDSNASLFVGVGYAAANADIVSNSCGGPEYPAETSDDAVFLVKKPVLFSAGDGGTGAQYPCTSKGVTCVGGTTLLPTPALLRASETGWSSGGGGCSAFEVSPSYQSGVGPCGSTRAVPDIAADADPNTGVAVYDNGSYYQVGGTSLATLLMAGLFADIMAARTTFGQVQFNYLNPPLYAGAVRNRLYFFFDVVLGNNGYPAGVGYDLVTGLGVLNGPDAANRFFGLIYSTLGK
jgi:subtilase family serine protease